MKQMLIVDDALIMRMKIRQIAEQAGWTVVAEAANGEEAVDMYRQHNPDLVTLDMVMPVMDGLAALKAIRAADANSRVVMVSALDQKDKLAECIAAGALDFIVKPFDSARLREFFERYGPKPESE